MRRIAFLTVAATAAVAAAAPSDAAAAHPCVASPSAQNCIGLADELSDGTVSQVIRIVKHPYDCVQDCDGPPPA